VELIRRTSTVRAIVLRGTSRVTRSLGFLVPLLVGSTAATAGSVIILVDDDALSGGDGASWATAYSFLQDALAFAADPDNDVTEIHVGQGLYLPDRDEATPRGTGVREATFQLVSGVALMGGYAGLGEPDPDDRDVTQNLTLLSGDLALDDGPGFANNNENAFQVVTGSGVDGTAVLDGFTITAGNANAIHVVDNGAGMNNDGGSPTVMRCTFVGNSAVTAGGGMYNAGGSPVVIGCLFLGNVAGFGGGLANDIADSTVVGCRFIGNSASDAGGMLNVASSPVVTNCVFVDNTAGCEGGGMFSREDGSCPIVTNCTFTGNTATTGGGLRNAAFGDALVFNTILWGNTAAEGPEISLFFSSTISVAYSDVQGGLAAMAVDGTSSVTWLAGNIDADPAFVDTLGPDGNPGTGDENVRLTGGSPAVDAGHNWAVPADITDIDGNGDPTELLPQDLDGNPRFAADGLERDPGCGIPVVVDMGAFEFEGSPFDVRLGDIDGDGAVGIVDFLAVLAAWGRCVDGCCLEDLDLDNEVGIADFLLLLGNWT